MREVPEKFGGDSAMAHDEITNNCFELLFINVYLNTHPNTVKRVA